MCRSTALSLLLPILMALPSFAQTSSDITAPLLTSFTFPASVDVSASAQTVTVNATITDDLSGFVPGFSPGASPYNVQFTSGNGQFLHALFSRTSGTALNGTYQAILTFPRFIQAGTWKAEVILQDAAGNRRTFQASDLQASGFPSDLLVIDSTVDTLPPTLLAASFAPATIDVSSSDVNVTLSLQISDNVSGASFTTITEFSAILMPPTASGSTAFQYLSNFDFHLVAGTALNGTWQAVKEMPRYSPNGPWQIQQLTLRDAATNTITLSTAQLISAGINPVLMVNSSLSDTRSPILNSLSFSPPLFNTSLGSQTVTITIGASDDLSGLDFTPTTASLTFIQVVLRSPSGGQVVFVNPRTVSTLVAGTPVAGTWQLTARWPQFSEEGTWQLDFFFIKDAAGNRSFYTPAMLSAMGLPSSIVVTKPELITDGQVGNSGGTVIDNSFGSRASLTFPPGVIPLAPTPTSVSIDVFASPPSVPTPRGFTAAGTYFVNLSFSPALSSPLAPPGITVVLPLLTPMTPGANLSLYHIDPVTGSLAPAMNADHNPVVGTVNADGVSATFLKVVTVSTVVAYLSNGSVLGDVDGNGSVTCSDVSLVKASFGRHVGQAGFNSAADLNNDTVVDIRDLILVTRQLPAGTTCP